MKKPKISLVEGEKVLRVQTGSHISSLFTTYFLWLIIFLSIFVNTKGINKLYALTTFLPVSVIDYRRRKETVILTNKRLFYIHLQYFFNKKISSSDRGGLIKEHKRKIELHKIRDNTPSKGFIYGLLNKEDIADLSISTSDRNTPNLTIKGIKGYTIFESKLDYFIDKRKDEKKPFSAE